MTVRIGIDFDNTLVGYDHLFGRLARERGWLTGREASGKDAVKRALIARDGHDRRWQALQAEAYGPRILEARAIPGALRFVDRARRAGHELYIVSHKSERSHLVPSIRLREWARRWLRENGAGLPERRVLFASTRDEKVRMISRLGLDIFIDDLPEVLAHPDFPPHTRKILFDRTVRWDAIARGVDAASIAGADATAIIEDALGGSCVRASALRSSGNNRLVKVALGDGRAVLVKRYLVDSRDGRPRARTEFDGLRLLWDAGVRDIPRPLAMDPAGRFAIYSWLPGRPLKAARPSDEVVLQAAAFLRRLRQLPSRTASRWTADGADARVRLSDYAGHIRRRLERVHAGAKALGHADALRLIEREVAPRAVAVLARFAAKAFAAGLDMDAALPGHQRWLSPSDFGLHNALLGRDGRVRFVDFEYFGWDDPAKLVADLFHHAAMKPLSARQRALFLERLLTRWSGAAEFRARLDLVLEPIALEWVLIILNVVSPEMLERRRFADPSLDPKRLIAERLRAARARLARIPE